MLDKSIVWKYAARKKGKEYKCQQDGMNGYKVCCGIPVLLILVKAPVP
jgi:hypothetical protein